ncbi:branched-chain amino acid transporter permease [Caproiciproducens sp. MSJ-32]|uniref:branched-chain amino acid transporter permease n=1 Tax=Caproiciproducens sp. MSJ-32 TaxID=2841527 RepID=UPI001C129720|nr:AzlD domain-containing protein [Caproiciproducens sp. MSJ-32]MBU5454233.1 AzlD domain-containing protein [Caproiciproducens sp. MSJ-32]
MTLTIFQAFIIICLAALATMITRFLPFILFKDAKSNNSYINFLGQVLPFSAIGLLVVYCLKNVNFAATSNWLPEAISVTVIVILHYWKENVLLSIGVGTIIYMFLIQVVFI